MADITYIFWCFRENIWEKSIQRWMQQSLRRWFLWWQLFLRWSLSHVSGHSLCWSHIRDFWILHHQPIIYCKCDMWWHSIKQCSKLEPNSFTSKVTSWCSLHCCQSKQILNQDICLITSESFWMKAWDRWFGSLVCFHWCFWLMFWGTIFFTFSTNWESGLLKRNVWWET